MDRLGWARSLMSQDVARSNAASAARRLSDRRREREAVDAFLAQRVDPWTGRAATGDGPDVRAAASPAPRHPVAAHTGSGIAAPRE
jgi:hypothetical protein